MTLDRGEGFSNRSIGPAEYSALHEGLKERRRLQDPSLGGRKVGQDRKVSFQRTADWLVREPDLQSAW